MSFSVKDLFELGKDAVHVSLTTLFCWREPEFIRRNRNGRQLSGARHECIDEKGAMSFLWETGAVSLGAIATSIGLGAIEENPALIGLAALNPIFLALFFGIAAHVTGIERFLPTFLFSLAISLLNTVLGLVVISVFDFGALTSVLFLLCAFGLVFGFLSVSLARIHAARSAVPLLVAVALMGVAAIFLVMFWPFDHGDPLNPKPTNEERTKSSV